MAVNMEAMMADAKAKNYIETVQSKMEGNAEVNALLEKAASLEDLFEVAKKYVTMKFEAFKAICHDAFAYFGKEDKVALSDETMEAVVGGGWLGNLWNKCKKVVTAVAVGVAAAAVMGGIAAIGVASGGLALGVLGTAVFAGVTGGISGVCAGAAQYLDNAFINVG